jgi:N-acyl-D-amino-acid deacylase
LGYELAIRNGVVIDGAGNPGFRTNVYIKDGRIARISRGDSGGADKIIDAAGLVVSPGFIDIHQHSDHTLYGNTRCESFIHQGVTTAAVGNCGLSMAPISDRHREEIIRYNEAFTYGTKVPYDWRSFGDYLDRLDETDIGLNFWPQIGHCTLRASVMGFEMRKATEREVDLMKAVLEEAFESGANALSTGAYAPGEWADIEELIELSKVAARSGGIYTTHLRRAGFSEAVEIGEKAGVPVEVAHYDGAGVAEARAKGLDITYNSYPYHAGSSLLGQVLPIWVYESGVDAMLDRLRQQGTRDKIRQESGRRDLGRSIVAHLPDERYKEYEGRTVGEIASTENIDPVDWVCDALLDNDGRGMYIHMNGRSEAYVFKTLRDPNQHIMSDGWALAPYGALHVGKPHQRCYGTFPRVLGWYVRECETIPIQEAVRKMTSAPALKMGLKDRGLLREGFCADVVVFNPRTVADRATFTDPHQYPVGVDYVIINGQVVIEKGEHTGALVGKVLRKGRERG